MTHFHMKSLQAFLLLVMTGISGFAAKPALPGTMNNYFGQTVAEDSVPDKEGFIRRWLLLEPIEKPNRSNTVFTDS